MTDGQTDQLKVPDAKQIENDNEYSLFILENVLQRKTLLQQKHSFIHFQTLLKRTFTLTAHLL